MARLLVTLVLYVGLALLQRRTSSPFATLGYLSCAVGVVAVVVAFVVDVAVVAVAAAVARAAVGCCSLASD